MRKLFSMMMALALMLGCAAWAETDPGMFEYPFGDFSVMLPEDMEGDVADTIENNVPFFMFYEDYDPEADFNATLNCVWSEDMVDIDSAEPTALAQVILEQTAQQYETMGISVVDSTLIGAEYTGLNGKHAMTAVYTYALDYSPTGEDLQYAFYTLQMYVPVKNGETYIFTLTAEDLLECERLVAVMNSIEWTV